MKFFRAADKWCEMKGSLKTEKREVGPPYPELFAQVESLILTLTLTFTLNFPTLPQMEEIRLGLTDEEKEGSNILDDYRKALTLTLTLTPNPNPNPDP